MIEDLPSLHENEQLHEIIEKLEKTNQKEVLFQEGERILVGLSGGADSMMLTHYLKFYAKIDVVACHIHHGLRGEESDRDMRFAETICNVWGIPFYGYVEDAARFAQQNNITVEEAGRNLRYQRFEETAQKVSAVKIATAHTLSDNCETILFHLVRGTGLKGLCGIPPKRDNIIRPLIALTRQEIESYCSICGIEYVTDSTNLSPIYTRNKIRQQVIPLLTEINPRIDLSIQKTIRILREEQDYLELLSRQAYAEAEKQNELSVDILVEYHTAIRYRVIRLFLKELGIEQSHDLILKVDEMLLKNQGKINVKENLFLEIKRNKLFLNDDSLIVDYYQQPLEFGLVMTPAGKRYEISLCQKNEIDEIKKVYKKLLYILIDYDKIKGKLILRSRKTGDKISLCDKQGSRSLKRLMIDYKLTASQKSRLLVIEDDEGVIALEQFGCDKRVCVDENTINFLVILLQDNEC